MIQLFPTWQFTFESLITVEWGIRKWRKDDPQKSNLTRPLR